MQCTICTKITRIFCAILPIKNSAKLGRCPADKNFQFLEKIGNWKKLEGVKMAPVKKWVMLFDTYQNFTYLEKNGNTKILHIWKKMEIPKFYIFVNYFQCQIFLSFYLANLCSPFIFYLGVFTWNPYKPYQQIF